MTRKEGKRKGCPNVLQKRIQITLNYIYMIVQSYQSLPPDPEGYLEEDETIEESQRVFSRQPTLEPSNVFLCLLSNEADNFPKESIAGSLTFRI